MKIVVLKFGGTSVGTVERIKKVANIITSYIKKRYKNYKVLYGGSVNQKNISDLKSIKNIDGYLIGGASQFPDKFIDIISKIMKIVFFI